MPVISKNIRDSEALNAVFTGFTDGVLVNVSSFDLWRIGNQNFTQFNVAALVALGNLSGSGDVVSHDSPSFFLGLPRYTFFLFLQAFSVHSSPTSTFHYYCLSQWDFLPTYATFGLSHTHTSFLTDTFPTLFTPRIHPPQLAHCSR